MRITGALQAAWNGAKQGMADYQTAEKGEVWPPKDAVSRLRRYERGLMLYGSRHQEVFLPDYDTTTGPYVTINVLRALTLLLTRRLVGTPPQPSAGEEGVADEQNALLDEITRNSSWERMLSKTVAGGSYRGDSVLKARFDAARDTTLVASVPPSQYFPEYDGEDPSLLLSASVSWVIDDPDGGPNKWLREERHTPGLIENLLWKLVKRETTGEVSWFRERVNLTDLPMFIGVPETVDTGIDEIPIVHVPNSETEETAPFGASDYEGLASLQDILNRKATRNATIHENFDQPTIVANESFRDEKGNWDTEKLRVLWTSQDEPAPSFIVPPLTHLDLASAETQQVILWMLLAAQVSPESFGLGEGGSAESGRAIALRQALTTSTVEGKRLIWEPSLRRVLSIATKLQKAQKAGAPDPLEPEDITLSWGTGLPRDETEAIDNAVKLKAAGLAAAKTLLRKLNPDWNVERLDEELAALESARPSMPSLNTLASTTNSPTGSLRERIEQRRQAAQGETP